MKITHSSTSIAKNFCTFVKSITRRPAPFLKARQLQVKQDLNGVSIVQLVDSERSLFRAKNELTLEPELIDLIDYLKPGEVFFDVGANVGTYSIYAAKKGIQVVAFEPSFPNSYAFSRNIELNVVSHKIQNLKVGLSDYIGIADLLHHKPTESGNSTASILCDLFKAEDTRRIFYRESCVVTTLDQVAQVMGIQPTLIKVDIDANEVNVIKGSVKTLSSPTTKYLQVEISDEIAQVEIQDLVTPYGFRLEKRIVKSSTFPQVCNLVFIKVVPNS